MKHYIKITFFLTLLLFCSNSIGQKEIYVDIECSNQYPGVAEQIKLSYVLKMKLKGGAASISHGGISIVKPTFTDINIVDEGKEGTGFGFGSMGGGAMKLYKYSFILQPKKKGKISIPPMSFKMNGTTYTSKAFTLSVGEGDPKAKIIPKNSNLFMRVEVSKSKLYVGEHALVTYKLYSAYRNIQLQDSDFPMTNGLWKEEITTPAAGWPQKSENINGKAYTVFTLKKEIVFPQKTGKIKLPAVSMDLSVGGGFFSQGRKESIKSNSPTLTVNPLPSGAPQSFFDLVGTGIKMEMSYSTNNLKSGEPIDVKIKLSGKGNLRQIDEPVLSFPQDFDVFDPEIIDKVKLSTSGLKGYKEFNFLVVPRYHGTFEIPAYKYSYFDLSTKKYKTLTFPAQTIKVEKSTNSQASPYNNTGVVVSKKEDVAILNNEIRHIVTNANLKPAKVRFLNSTLFWSGLIVPPSIFGIMFLLLKAKPKEKDTSLIAQKRASKNALKTLNTAQEKLNKNDNEGFYKSLYQGLLKYLGNKFKIPTSALNKEKIQQTFEIHNVPESDRAAYMSILEECEMAQYAPITHQGAVETMTKAKETIQNIESHVK